MKNKKNILITTPIYYPNDKLHIGHAYTTSLCDAFKEFQLMLGNDCFFLTGSDEHGQKIEAKAKEKGIPPKLYTDNIIKDFKKLWKMLDINYDEFIRTTDKHHKEKVQIIFTKLLEKNLLYKGNYHGNYCVSCEESFTKSQLIDGNKCPICNRVTEIINEESYFLKVSQFKNWIKEIFKNNVIDIIPSNRKTELLNNFVDELTDLSITRTNFDWGIRVKEDSKHVIYVWIDALSNYITALDWPDGKNFKKYWAKDSQVVHVIGKEITRFHCIYWPIILNSLDIRQPNKIISHGWITVDGEKMSKSKGNVVDPMSLIERYGNPDTLKFFLLKNIKIGKDGIFNNDLYKETYNNDLVNNLANLFFRYTSMLEKYNNSQLKKHIEKAELSLFKAEIQKIKDSYVDNVNKLDFSSYINNVLEFANFCNKYIEIKKPWVLKKEQKESELASFLYIMANAIILIFWLLSPILKQTWKKVEDVFSIKASIDPAKIFSLDFLGEISLKQASYLFERDKD